MKQNKKIQIAVVTFCFLSTGIAFQNCSLGKFNTSSSSESSNQQAATSIDGGFTAPHSTSGAGTTVIAATTGEKTLIAKEYRHKSYDRYFITTRIADQGVVEPGGALGADWELTGNTYSFNETQVADTSALCRFFIHQTRTHFYTADDNECLQLRNNSNFAYEGVEGYVVKINPNSSCPSSSTAVYRAYSNASSNDQKRHRFSASASVMSQLVSQGWAHEGVSFCVAAAVVVQPVVVVTPVTPPVTSGAIQCGTRSFTNFNTFKAAVCAESFCSRLNGAAVNCGVDQFGPCNECTSGTINPPVTPAPVNPPPAPVTPPPVVIAPAPAGAGCPSGVVRPHMSNSRDAIAGNESTPYRLFSGFTGNPNFTYNKLALNQGVWAAKIYVDASDSTVSQVKALPSFSFLNDDTAVFCNKRVTVSRSCADFGSSSQLVSDGQLSTNVKFATADDPRKSGSATVTLASGIWYVNVRAECAEEGSTSISGIFRAWTPK